MLTPRKFLWAFITEQSEGEWDEDTIHADIDRFIKMLEKERLALVPASLQERVKRLEIALQEVADCKDFGAYDPADCTEEMYDTLICLIQDARAALRESEDSVPDGTQPEEVKP